MEKAFAQQSKTKIEVLLGDSCPAKTGHIKCPLGGDGDFCSSSSYGLALKYSVKANQRKFRRIPRHTLKFKRLYKKRTAVERVNSRLKEHLVWDMI